LEYLFNPLVIILGSILIFNPVSLIVLSVINYPKKTTWSKIRFFVGSANFIAFGWGVLLFFQPFLNRDTIPKSDTNIDFVAFFVMYSLASLCIIVCTTLIYLFLWLFSVKLIKKTEKIEGLE
jgi:hypothetical protein